MMLVGACIDKITKCVINELHFVHNLKISTKHVRGHCGKMKVKHPTSCSACRPSFASSAAFFWAVAQVILKNVGSEYLFKHAPCPASSNLVRTSMIIKGSNKSIFHRYSFEK